MARQRSRELHAPRPQAATATRDRARETHIATLDGAKDLSAHGASLLDHPTIAGRGHTPTQFALLHQMQQAYGNQAVQRYMQTRLTPPAPGRRAGAPTTMATLERPSPAAVRREWHALAPEIGARLPNTALHPVIQRCGGKACNCGDEEKAVQRSPKPEATAIREREPAIDPPLQALAPEPAPVPALAPTTRLSDAWYVVASAPMTAAPPDHKSASPSESHAETAPLRTSAPPVATPKGPDAETALAALNSAPLASAGKVPAEKTPVHAAKPAVQRFTLNPIEAAKSLAQAAIGAIRNLGSAALNTAKSLGGTVWNSAKNAGSSAWNGIKGTGLSIWNTTKSLGTRALSGAASLGTAAWNAVKGMGASIWTSAKGLGTRAWDQARRLGTQAWDAAKRLGSGAWGTVSGAAGKAWDAVKGMGGRLWSRVKGAAGKAWTTAQSWGAKALAAAKTAASHISMDDLCKAVGWLTEKAYDNVAPLVKRGYAQVKAWGGKAWTWASEHGGKLWNAAKAWGGKVWDRAKGAVGKAFSAVKGRAASAWSTAKRLGSGAWNTVKGMAGRLWGQAKSLGSRAWTTAKSLGQAAWNTAKSLGSKIASTAKSAASKLTSLANKLTGGAAGKVAAMANKILGKAAGLLSWVVSTATSLANRAIETAKTWAAKAIETAKSWASKAWSAAKSAASRAIGAAKGLAGKAWTTAKGWAAKAWSAAKGLGSKALSTVKGWASKAWGAAKSLGGRAWSTVKGWGGKAWGAAKKVGGAVAGYAKKVGQGALGVAKSLGLDKAWHWVKGEGGKALDLLKEAGAALKKRFGPLVEKVANAVKEGAKKGAMAAALATPAGASLALAYGACKTLGCALPKLVAKGSHATQEVADVATDLIPYVSTVKDTCACVTGENMITNKAVGTGERAVRCTVAAIDIAAMVAAPASPEEQVAKTGIRAWLKGLLKLGGKEAEHGLLARLMRIFKLEGKEAAEKAAKEAAEKAAREAAEGGAKGLVRRVVKFVNAIGEEHELRLLEDGRIIRCSDLALCLQITDSVGKRVADILGRVAKESDEAKELARLEAAAGAVATDVRNLAAAKDITAGERAAKEAELLERAKNVEMGLSKLERGGDLLTLLGRDVLNKLVKDLEVAGAQKLVDDLGALAVRNLAKHLEGKEIAELVTKHGKDAVKWLGESLTGQAAKELAEKLGNDALRALMKGINSKEAAELVESLGESVVKDLAKGSTGKEIQTLLGHLGETSLKKLCQDLGAEEVGRLLHSMDSSTLHQMGLAETIAKVGLDEFIAIVKKDGADAMIYYGAEALQKVGKATLDAAASLSQAICSDTKKLQHVFDKHAKDFGIMENWKQKDTALHARFMAALNGVVSKPDSVFVGPYRAIQWAAHFFQGDRVVIVEITGELETAFGKAANKLAGIRGLAPPVANPTNFRVK